MIPPKKGGLAQWVIDRYVDRKVRSAFRGVWCRGTLPPGGALLVYANHSNFWDGFILHQLARRAQWDVYCMMEERNLSRYRFLARLGAFSVRRGDARSALQSLKLAKGLIERPGAAVAIFPQGAIKPPGQLPMTLERGVEVLARASGARCLPLAIRYAFFEDERPDVLVELGEPHDPAPLAHFQATLEERWARVASATSVDGFWRCVAGKSGVAQRWDKARDRLRGLPAASRARG